MVAASHATRRARLLLSLYAVGVASLLAAATAQASADAPGKSLRTLASADFAVGPDGWVGYRSKLTTIRHGVAGKGLRVSPALPRSDFLASPARRAVASAKRNTTYHARAWIRSSSRSTVCLRTRHVVTGRLLQTTRACVRGPSGWRLVTARLRPSCSGGSVGLDIASRGAAGFDLDSVAVTARSSADVRPTSACTSSLKKKKPAPTNPAPAPTEPTPVEPVPTEPAPAPAPTESPLQPRSFLNPFPQGSIWNTALPDQPAVDPTSAEKIAYWLTQIRYPNMVLRAYATAIAVATPQSATQSVTCTVYVCPDLNQYGGVPFPAGTVPDPSSDRHLAVWDPATSREWDFWISECPTSCARTASGGSFTTNTLTPNVRYGANAASVPLLAGIVHPEEIRAGHIPHPLVFATPNVGKGQVCPASRNDGGNLDARALKEGTLLQLDPSVDVAALPIPGWQKTIARALQQYGMYLVDGGGTLSIGAENPVNRGDLWGELGLFGNSAMFASSFPWGKMRVLLPRSPWCA